MEDSLGIFMRAHAHSTQVSAQKTIGAKHEEDARLYIAEAGVRGYEPGMHKYSACLHATYACVRMGCARLRAVHALVHMLFACLHML